MMWRILTAWDFDLSVVIGCVLLLIAYFWSNRPNRIRALWFVSGVAMMFLALVSPLDVLSDDYLFSAHMLQHLVLILIVPPLLLLGLTRNFVRTVIRPPSLRKLERVLGTPAVAWPLGMVTLWVWHVPRLYDAAVANEWIHISEHLCFMITATIFWWPILSPLEELRMKPLGALLYLLGGAISNSLLGILIFFASPGFYPAYLHPNDWLHILPLIRGTWGLTPQADQELGGLLMWVPGGLVFLIAMIATLFRWFRMAEPDEPAAMARLIKNRIA